MKTDIRKDIIREQKHEKAVKQFLNNANVAEDYIHYDNFTLFANAKRTIKFATVTEQHIKVLNKFSKRWVQLKGVITLKDTKRIQSIVKYYAQKEHNYKCKQRRLQTRAVKKIVIQA